MPTLVTTAEQARDALIRQVTGAVQWDKSMRALIALGVQNFVEVGPGKVLCGLMRQIDRSRTCVNVDRRSVAAENSESLQPGVDQAGLTAIAVRYSLFVNCIDASLLTLFRSESKRYRELTFWEAERTAKSE